MADNPFELLNKSQRLALNVAGEAFDTLLSVGRTATQPELADTMANLATMQAELAELVETLAHRHATIVESLENLTAPVFGLVAQHQTAEPTPAPKPRAKKK
jgi:hypothetical protein